MQYDEQWIIAFAMALEAKAKSMIRNARYLSIAMSSLLAIGAASSGHASIWLITVTGLLSAFVLWNLLVSRAENQAAMLRLQAHTALCQVQIERNTRK